MMAREDYIESCRRESFKTYMMAECGMDSSDSNRNKLQVLVNVLYLIKLRRISLLADEM